MVPTGHTAGGTHHAGWDAQGRKQQVCVRRLRENGQTHDHASVVRRDAASMGIQTRLAYRTVVEGPGYGVRGCGRRCAVPLERRRTELEGPLRLARPRDRAPLAA